jgi:hypothetical protein
MRYPLALIFDHRHIHYKWRGHQPKPHDQVVIRNEATVDIVTAKRQKELAIKPAGLMTVWLETPGMPHPAVWDVRDPPWDSIDRAQMEGSAYGPRRPVTGAEQIDHDREAMSIVECVASVQELNPTASGERRASIHSVIYAPIRLRFDRCDNARKARDDGGGIVDRAPIFDHYFKLVRFDARLVGD